MNEASKKVYKTRHDWVGKLIHQKLYKRLNFDQNNKWYMHKPESVLENETHKILLDFEIQINHLIQVKRPKLVSINKKKRTGCQVGFTITVDYRVKIIKKSEKIDKYLDLARKLKRQWNMKVMVTSIVMAVHRMVPKALEERLKEAEISRRIKSIQTTRLLRSARIPRRVLEN